jgi:hypothetical protein
MRRQDLPLVGGAERLLHSGGVEMKIKQAINNKKHLRGMTLITHFFTRIAKDDEVYTRAEISEMTGVSRKD